MDKKCFGHFFAIITILIWGTTFISTKLLLQNFRPMEILLFRFVIGFFALLIIYPKPIIGTSFKQEITFALAGICGITLYYLLENIALTYTTASAVGVIISTAPFSTAILSYFVLEKKEKLSFSFFMGFVISMAGICLLSFENLNVDINPLGDILAFISAIIWALYSVLSKKSVNMDTIQFSQHGEYSYMVLFL